MKSSKLYEVLVTNLTDKYRTDIFFRTTCRIVFLQLIFTAILIAIFWYALRRVETGIVSAIVGSIHNILEGGGASNTFISTQLHEVTSSYFISAVFLTTIATLAFGFLMIHIALTPTRRSFERKKRFISNIAHEIRTPLAIIRTNSDVALLDGDTPPEIKEILLENIEQLERMSNILNNLLTLSNVMRVDTLNFKDVDLQSLVEKVIRTMTHLRDQKNIEIRFDPTPHLTVLGNATALEQVVFNILKNAIIYSPEGGMVEISTSPRGKKFVDIVIKDTGVGISSEDLLRIFEPFYRAKRTQKEAGSGVGLTIVEEIIKIHKGKIAIRSTPSRGTTVIISIPSGNKGGSTASESMLIHDDSTPAQEVQIDFSGSLF